MASGKSLLVCDDDPLLLELLEFKLNARGYEVALARDGAEAMNRVGEAVPDLIVLDAMMPAPDGFEVLRRIKEDEALRHIPVLMLTSRKEERDIVTALEIGASDYIVKPFNPDELVARLSRLIAHPPR